MTSLLTWRSWAKPDRAALQRHFECTDPPKRAWNGRTLLPHPAEWELDVQAAVRQHKPNPRRGDVMLVGEDDRGIAAVVAWSRYGAPDRVLLQLIAVHVRHRHTGGACAREALSTALAWIMRDAAESGTGLVVIEARIHTMNQPSKRLFARAGFVLADRWDEDYEVWAYAGEV